jgi:hypothetical protein
MYVLPGTAGGFAHCGGTISDAVLNPLTLNREPAVAKNHLFLSIRPYSTRFEV